MQILPQKRDRQKLKWPSNKIIIPAKGEYRVGCGKCGNTDYRVFLVRPKNGLAKIKEIRCTKCGKRIEFDDQGNLGSNRIKDGWKKYDGKET